MNLRYYPAFIDLKGRECVVVGGGRVAERKVMSLLQSGARIKVISPEITGVLQKYKRMGMVRHIKRNYRKGDLKNTFLVIAATSDESVNKAVSRDAPCLVNVVDKPVLANFIVPSVVKKGFLTIAVSTSGASPAMARAIRKEIETIYSGDFGHFAGFLKKLRKKASVEIPGKRKREGFLKGIFSEDIFNILRKKGLKKAKERVIKKFDAAKGRSSG